MVEDASLAQARLLLQALYEQVVKISRTLEKVEQRSRYSSARSLVHEHRQRSALRRDLYEAHRLIEVLQRRFPDTLIAERTRF